VVEPDSSTRTASPARTGAIGTLVAAYAFFDVIPIAIIVVGSGP
jgi:hypothetical protein